MHTSFEVTKSSRRLSQWLKGVWALTFALTGFFEIRRFIAASQSESGVVSWLIYWDIESTLSFFALLTFPLALLFHRSGQAANPRNRTPLNRRQIFARGLILTVLSMSCSWWIGASQVSIADHWKTQQLRFSDLPPAYHDEYSYLLQARTFSAGRLSWPAMTVRPDLFHQMHVLNERRTMSRYFPWTGLWLAPFESVGHPVWGQWLAGGLATFFFYLSMIQVVSPGTAFLSGLLIAMSPGISVFSNLLLAHHPTMLALSVFMCAFFRMMTTHRLRWAFIAGIGLTLAMLGRPMTAAGFALPFGMWLAVYIFRTRRFPLALGLGVPLLAGFCCMAILNLEATGSPLRSAYQDYTDTYTPSHRYGFNNVVESIGDRSKVLTSYDAWATNLTPALALENVWNRLFYSAQWSLALFPLLFGIMMALPLLLRSKLGTADLSPSQRWGLGLIFLSIIFLHAVHIPYWFDGIMHWHYVFETAPLVIMLACVGFAAAYDVIDARCGTRPAVFCLASLIFAGLAPGWISAEGFGITSKVSAAVNELSFSRARFEVFHRLTDNSQIQHPALVMVDERQGDPQLSYVINDPQLKASVIICRRPESESEIHSLQTEFPNRTLYEFDPATMQLNRY